MVQLQLALITIGILSTQVDGSAEQELGDGSLSTNLAHSGKLVERGTGETQEEWRAALSALHKVKIKAALRHGDATKRLRPGKYLTFFWDYAGWNNNQIHFELMVAMAIRLRRRLVIPLPHHIDHLSSDYHDSMVYNLDVMQQEAGTISHDEFEARMGCKQLSWYKGYTIPKNWQTDMLPKAVNLAEYRKSMKHKACNGTEMFVPMLSGHRIASFRMLEDPEVFNADILFMPQEKFRITRYECFIDLLPPCDRFVATAGVFNALEYKQDLIDAAADEMHRLGLKAGEFDAYHWRAGDFKDFAVGDKRWQYIWEHGNWSANEVAKVIRTGVYEQSKKDMADECCAGKVEEVSKKSKAKLLATSQIYPPLLVLSNINPKNEHERRLLAEFIAAYPGKVVQPDLGVPCDTSNGCKKRKSTGGENPMLPIITDVLMPLAARFFVGTSQSTFSLAIHKMRNKVNVARKYSNMATKVIDFKGNPIVNKMYFTDSMVPVEMPYSMESLGNHNSGSDSQICWNRYTHWNDITNWSPNAHRKCLASFVRAPGDAMYQN